MKGGLSNKLTGAVAFRWDASSWEPSGAVKIYKNDFSQKAILVYILPVKSEALKSDICSKAQVPLLLPLNRTCPVNISLAVEIKQSQPIVYKDRLLPNKGQIDVKIVA